MQLIEILVVAFALSLDAFAFSLAAGTSGFVRDRRAVFRLSFHFGLFQFLMPILGWALGVTIEPTMEAFDHWIAFSLLAIVGVRMIMASMDANSQNRHDDPSHGLTLVMLALATSIDAMAVGLSMAMIRMPVWYPSIIIGVVAASMSVLAIVAGSRVGGWLGKRAQLAGGILLPVIGVRIVISHLA